MPTRYQTDPYGRTRQYGPSPGTIPPADLYDVPYEEPSFLRRLLDTDVGQPVRNIGKFLGAAAGIPGVELAEDRPGSFLDDTGFVGEWLKNVGGNIRSTYGAPTPPGPSTAAPAPQKPAPVVKAPDYGPGWQTVPGTQAFSGGPGRWREEFPLEGATPPGNAPAKSWLDYNKTKYGQDYAAERTVGTPEYEAGGTTPLASTKLFKLISNMDPTKTRVHMYQQTGIDKPFWSQNELLKQIVELPQLEYEAKTAANQKILDLITDKEQQRRENAWLAQATSGGRLGAMPSEGLSTEGLKRIQQILTGARADERLENEQARLAESERRGRVAGPSRSAIITRTELLLLEKGMTAEKTPAGNLVVYRNKRPVEGSEQILAATMREAERQLRAGAP